MVTPRASRLLGVNAASRSTPTFGRTVYVYSRERRRTRTTTRGFRTSARLIRANLIVSSCILLARRMRRAHILASGIASRDSPLLAVIKRRRRFLMPCAISHVYVTKYTRHVPPLLRASTSCVSFFLRFPRAQATCFNLNNSKTYIEITV